MENNSSESREFQAGGISCLNSEDGGKPPSCSVLYIRVILLSLCQLAIQHHHTTHVSVDSFHQLNYLTH